jgi:hypothetical protein
VNTELLASIVLRRRTNPTTILSGEVLALLDDVFTSFEQRTDDQSIYWSPENWKKASALYVSESCSATLATRVPITRSDVFALREDPLALFYGAMVFGFGTTGYGASRTSKLVTSNGIDRVRAFPPAIKEAYAIGALPTMFNSWRDGGSAKLRGLDTAFASKIAYFGIYDREVGDGPLIADINTAWAIWALAGIQNSLVSADAYARYVSTALEWAKQLGRRSDDIERCLFSLGKLVSAIAKRDRRG